MRPARQPPNSPSGNYLYRGAPHLPSIPSVYSSDLLRTPSVLLSTPASLPHVPACPQESGCLLPRCLILSPAPHPALRTQPRTPTFPQVSKWDPFSNGLDERLSQGYGAAGKSRLRVGEWGVGWGNPWEGKSLGRWDAEGQAPDPESSGSVWIFSSRVGLKTSAPLTRLACAEVDLFSTSHFANSSGLTGCHKWHSLLRTARPLGKVKWAAVSQGKEGCTASSAVCGKPVVRCASGFWCLKFAHTSCLLGNFHNVRKSFGYVLPLRR